jgi:hypothetical protein
VEGVFGVGKRRYLLDLVKARLSDTSLSWICASFFAMNLMTLLRQSLFFVYFLLVRFTIRRITGLFQALKSTFVLELKLLWGNLQPLHPFYLRATAIRAQALASFNLWNGK